MIDYEKKEALDLCARNIPLFTHNINGLMLRRYQVAAAKAIVDSVRYNYGDSLVVMFPRQSGKNELQAQLQSYLLFIYALIEC